MREKHAARTIGDSFPLFKCVVFGPARHSEWRRCDGSGGVCIVGSMLGCMRANLRRYLMVRSGGMDHGPTCVGIHVIVVRSMLRPMKSNLRRRVMVVGAGTDHGPTCVGIHVVSGHSVLSRMKPNLRQRVMHNVVAEALGVRAVVPMVVC